MTHDIEKPYWIMTAPKNTYEPFGGEKNCDVAIIGGGMTGITAAYLLASRGVDTVLLEAEQIGHGTTGRTTGKVTYHHTVKYHKLLSGVGAEKARMYAEANRSGLDQVAEWVGKFNIDCDFARVDSYVYALNDNELSLIEKEMDAYEELGISAEFMHSCPLPFEIRGAVMVRDQAQFHPLKYLYGLAAQIDINYCSIHEHSPVDRLEYTDKCVIHANGGKVYADKVIIATNYPVKDEPGLYFARLYQQRSYIAGMYAEGLDIKGIYINADEPVHSFRMQPDPGGLLIFAAGYGNRTGKDVNCGDNYALLKQTLENNLGVTGELVYNWSAQDCMTLDGLPYAGQLTKNTPHIYVATGYEKWGMAQSTACAMLVTGMLLGENNPASHAIRAYTPQRFILKASAGELAAHLGEVLFELGLRRAAMPARTPEDLEPGEGDIMRLDGRLAAVYRDEGGKLWFYHAHCMHMGCILNFNAVDKSWDCACHGSRFDVHGNVITGPAVRPLEKFEL